MPNLLVPIWSLKCGNWIRSFSLRLNWHLESVILSHWMVWWLKHRLSDRALVYSFIVKERSWWRLCSKRYALILELLHTRIISVNGLCLIVRGIFQWISLGGRLWWERFLWQSPLGRLRMKSVERSSILLVLLFGHLWISLLTNYHWCSSWLLCHIARLRINITIFSHLEEWGLLI